MQVSTQPADMAAGHKGVRHGCLQAQAAQGSRKGFAFKACCMLSSTQPTNCRQGHSLTRVLDAVYVIVSQSLRCSALAPLFVGMGRGKCCIG